MSLVVLGGVGLLGGVGALARFALDGAVSARIGRALPFGTLAVNVSGAFALGVLVGAALHGDALRLIGTGALGGYTTFSTLMFETHRLGEDGEIGASAANVLVSLLAGLGAAALGRALGGLL